MNVRRFAVAALLPAAACGGLLLSTATPASAAAQGACGDTKDASTSGAEAHWTISCSSATGKVSVTGWVKDTDADGQCAQVYAYFPSTGNYKYSAQACPKGEVQYFTLTDTGTSANVYLREVG